jgi:hypothetical protein
MWLYFISVASVVLGSDGEPLVDVVQDDSWTIIQEFFNTHGLVRQQLDSYNAFVTTTMQRIVDEYSALEFFPAKSPRNDKIRGLVRSPSPSVLVGACWATKMSHALAPVLTARRPCYFLCFSHFSARRSRSSSAI